MVSTYDMGHRKWKGTSVWWSYKGELGARALISDGHRVGASRLCSSFPSGVLQESPQSAVGEKGQWP